MKQGLFLSAALFTLLFSIASCSKETTQERIIGIWRIDSVQLRVFINNQVVYSTILRPSGDYYDFRTDNNLYRRWQGNLDTAGYTLGSTGDKQWIKYAYSSADTILTLTSNQLLLKNPQGSDSKIFLSKN